MDVKTRNRIWLSYWNAQEDDEIKKMINSFGRSYGRTREDCNDAYGYAICTSLEKVDTFDNTKSFPKWIVGIGIMWLKYKCKHDDLLEDLHSGHSGRWESVPRPEEVYNFKKVVFRMGKRHKQIRYVSLKENAQLPIRPRSQSLYKMLTPGVKYRTTVISPVVKNLFLEKGLNTDFRWENYGSFLQLHY